MARARIRTVGRWSQRLGTAACVLLLLGLGVGPRTGAYQGYTVLSSSMEPGLPAGSVALVTPKPATEVTVGDVLVYRIPVENRRVIAHRVVDVVEPGVVRTQGDRNADPDWWTAELTDRDAWVVRGHVPWLGHALIALRQPVARFVLVALCPALFALLAVWRIWRRQPAPARVALVVRVPQGPAPEWYTRALAAPLPAAGPRSGRHRRAAVVSAVSGLLLVVAAGPALAVLSDSVAATHAVATGGLVAPAVLDAQLSCDGIGHQVALSWSATTDSLSQGYRLERSTDGAAYATVATPGVTTTAHLDGSLAADTSYAYRIRSERGTWSSPWTLSPTVTTPADPC